MSLPWMPFYVADYRADTGHLRAAQHGAYLLLIMHYWQKGSLPNDDAQLGAIACMSPAEWKKARPIIEPFFEGGWKHKRIDHELVEAMARHFKRSAAGKAGGEASAKARQSSSNAAPGVNQPQPQPPAPKKEEPSLRSGAREKQRERARKAPTTPIPDNWRPSEDVWESARKLGLSDTEIDREIQRFTNNAKSNDRRLVDWGAGFRNWCIKAVEILGRKPPTPAGQELITIRIGEPSWNAWLAYNQDNEKHFAVKMMNAAAEANRGFVVPSIWPPGHQHLQAAE